MGMKSYTVVNPRKLARINYTRQTGKALGKFKEAENITPISALRYPRRNRQYFWGSVPLLDPDWDTLEIAW